MSKHRQAWTRCEESNDLSASRNYALPPRPHIASAIECRVFIDHDDGAIDLTSHMLPRISVEYGTRSTRNTNGIVDSISPGPVRCTGLPKYQGDPSAANFAFGRRVDLH